VLLVLQVCARVNELHNQSLHAPQTIIPLMTGVNAPKGDKGLQGLTGEIGLPGVSGSSGDQVCILMFAVVRDIA
jgi:hypothetical protein